MRGYQSRGYTRPVEESVEYVTNRSIPPIEVLASDELSAPEVDWS